MLTDILFGVVGITNAAIFIFIARKFTLESWAYTRNIAILPTIYLGFALYAASPEAALQELLYGTPYIVLACLAFVYKSRSFLLLTGGAWLVHGLYDVAHDVLFINPGVWFWYPAFCAGFDIGIGGYLLFTHSRIGTGFTPSERA